MSDWIRAGTTTITGYGGDEIEAYLAHPEDGEPGGGVVLIHHMPGYDRATKEMARTIATQGYVVVCPNLYSREAPGVTDPVRASEISRERGWVPDERLLGDVEGALACLRSQPGHNGRIGVIGHCSGGRHAFLVGTTMQVDAIVDCYGAFIVADPPEGMPAAMRPILDRAPQLACPMLGLFGEEDVYPTIDEVRTLEAELTRHGKDIEFHVFEKAGHAFCSVDRPHYRPKAAVEAWRLVFEFFGRHLDLR